MAVPPHRPRHPKPLEPGKLDPKDESLFDFLINCEHKVQSTAIRTHGTTQPEWQGYHCVVATVPDDRLDELRTVVPFRHFVHTRLGLTILVGWFERL